MFAHVLVPLDGSPLAEQAISYAKQVVKPDGKLVLVSVVRLSDVLPPGYSPLFAVPYRSGENDLPTDYVLNESLLLSETKDYLERVAKTLKGDTQLTVEFVAVTGNAAEVIVAEASHRAVDAIVMSTHGRSGISRWLFGSVTLRMLEAAPCPVLVIPSKHLNKGAEPSKAEAHHA
jgi:nucleotide-binding universal stress UspA family protein